MKGKRIVNYRPMCLVAMGLALGIIVGEGIYGFDAAWLALPLSLGVITTTALGCVKSARKFLLIPLAFVIGVSGITISDYAFDSTRHLTTYGVVYCRVASECVIDVENKTTTFYATDLRTENWQVKYDAKVRYYSDGIDFNAGDLIAIKGKLYEYRHEKFESDFDSRRENYVCNYITADRIEKIGEGKLEFPFSLKHRIKEILNGAMDADQAHIAQALLLGDKFGIDEGLYNAVIGSGLAHVLAVSGLHITTLITALYFILKKLKINAKFSFVLVTILSLLYSMLCAFSPSSLRAVIMSGAFNFASTFGRKKDSLSTLAAAATLILLFSPSSLMSAGFLLSFFAMFGLITFSAPLRRVGMAVVNKVSPKHHFGKRFVDVCAASIATNLAVYPIVAHFFGSVPILFILSNFIVLPYIMAVYVILLLLMLFALVTTLGQVMWLANILLYPFVQYVYAIGSLSFASVKASVTVTGTVGYYGTMFLFAPQVMFTPKQRIRYTLLAAALALTICLIADLLPV